MANRLPSGERWRSETDFRAHISSGVRARGAPAWAGSAARATGTKIRQMRAEIMKTALMIRERDGILRDGVVMDSSL